MKAEVIVELDPQGNDRVGGHVAVGLGLGDDDTWRLVPEHPRVVTHGVSVLKPFGVLEREAEAGVVGEREVSLEAVPGRVIVDRRL